MITSKPKTTSLIAIGLFLIGLWAADILLFIALLQNPESYFWAKLILAPTLLVIGLMVAIKSYFSTLTLTLGNNQLTYRYYIGSEKKYKIKEISSYKEEVVKRKNSEYRSLSIKLADGKTLRLSNHENNCYNEVFQYLSKKVRSKQML